MKKRMMAVMCVTATVGVFANGATDVDLARLVAADVSKPVRPAGVNGQSFWNGASWMFMYPPSFEFKKVPQAVKYRFLAIDDWHREHVMDATEPTALLTPMWGEIPFAVSPRPVRSAIRS